MLTHSYSRKPWVGVTEDNDRASIHDIFSSWLKNTNTDMMNIELSTPHYLVEFVHCQDFCWSDGRQCQSGVGTTYLGLNISQLEINNSIEINEQN